MPHTTVKTREARPVDQLDVFGVPEAAQYMGLCERTVVELLRSGQLVGRRVGKPWKIHRDAIREYLMPKPPARAAAPEPTRMRRA